MASVLFIVTIPTQAEEARLISEENSIRNDPNNVDLLTPTTTKRSSVLQPRLLKNIDINSNEGTEDVTTTDHVDPNKNLQCDSHGIQGKSQSSPQLIVDFVTDNVTNGMDNTNIEAVDAVSGVRKPWESIKDILSSTNHKAHKKNYIRSSDLEIVADTSMEVVLKEILKNHNIQQSVWTMDTTHRMHQVIFTIEFDEIYEKILDKFYEWGIGEREGSTVSVMSCIAAKMFNNKNDSVKKEECRKKNIRAQKQGAWNRFMNSIQSRLNTAQIVRDVRQDAAITFDFVVLLISASILASFGLVKDSTIFLASSMLISPLMGPIIAAIFGTVIKDTSLRTLGLKNEILGILIAVVVGFLFGMVDCNIDERYEKGEGLTKEMLSRCVKDSLLIGFLTAVPSGAAAAIGTLGGNIGSLVGVAISASLLPPAVNSGLLWALACVYKLFESDPTRYTKIVNTNFYSDNQAIELTMLGLMSMCLTLLNVICIYIMGILVLKVKEIAPVISQNNHQFWKHDIKIARDLHKNDINRSTAIINEFANLPKEDQKALGINCDFLRNIRLENNAYHHTWSPIGLRHNIEMSYEPIQDYSTIHEIEQIYSSICPEMSRLFKNYSHVHRLFKENDNNNAMDSNKHSKKNGQRRYTIPSTTPHTPVNFDTPIDIISENLTPTYPKGSAIIDNNQKRHTFIVTPAEDPLLFSTPTEGFNA